MSMGEFGLRTAQKPGPAEGASARGLGASSLIALMCILLAACTNPRRDAQVEARVSSRGQAIETLNTELTAHGVHMRGVSAGEQELYWESDYFGEAAPPPKGEQAWLGNTLGYAEIRRVSEVSRDALGWQVELDASGGKVRLRLDDRESALKVRAALLLVAKE